MKRIMGATKGLGQRGIKWSTKDYFIFDSWFYSKRLVEYSMGIGTDMVGMVTTNTKGLCKDTIDNIKNDCPGASYLTPKRKYVVPGDRLIIDKG